MPETIVLRRGLSVASHRLVLLRGLVMPKHGARRRVYK